MKKVDKLIVMLVDDDEDDRFFIREALEKAVQHVTVVEAEDGEALLNLLHDSDQQKVDEAVSVILLDMNMPRLNGLETVAAIRANPFLAHIPAVMISTTAQPELVADAYAKGINSFIKKPSSYADFGRIAEAIRVCFLDVVVNQ
ncbi:MAG: response regulator [Bacteroidetes bacterium]|nr:response regulator [Fibrella sp.]